MGCEPGCATLADGRHEHHFLVARPDVRLQRSLYDILWYRIIVASITVKSLSFITTYIYTKIAHEKQSTAFILMVHREVLKKKQKSKILIMPKLLQD